MVTIDGLRDNRGYESVKDLDFKKGNATLVYTTQSIQTNSGTLEAIIPFSGYAGSIVTPNFTSSWVGTTSQQESLTIAINPSLKYEPRLTAQSNALKNVEIGSTVEKAIVAKYMEMAQLRRSHEKYTAKDEKERGEIAKAGTRKPYAPIITPKSLTFTFKFVTERTNSGKLWDQIHQLRP